jgi:iron complex transport system substrate-binding protein
MLRTRATPWLVVCLCLLGAAAGFAGGATEAPAPAPQGAATAGSVAYPLTVKDDGGSAVTIPKMPERIVSITLFTDEILLDIVDPARIVAVTAFAADPDVSNVAARVGGISNKVTLAVEPVLALRPDLVFVSSWSEADKVKQLRDAGVAVYLVGSGITVADIEAKIREVARAVGEPERGDKVVAGMEARLAVVRDKVSKLAADKRATVVDFAVWGSAQGAGSSWDEIVRAAGLVNAVASLKADQYGQVPLSKEKLVELDPDLLILPGWVYGDPRGAEAFFKQTVGDPALAGMKAIVAKRAYQMPERLKSTVSQYVVDAVEYLAKTAYPDLFR